MLFELENSIEIWKEKDMTSFFGHRFVVQNVKFNLRNFNKNALWEPAELNTRHTCLQVRENA